MTTKPIKVPDSDIAARRRKANLDGELGEEPLEHLEDLQTSNKSGSHSSVEKLAGTRTDHSPRAAAGHVSGAFGDDEPQVMGTGQFRCNACGRFFDIAMDLSEHEIECRLAKQATRQGMEELKHEDSVPHAPNDHGR